MWVDPYYTLIDIFYYLLNLFNLFYSILEGRGVLSKGIALSTMGYLQRFELQNQVRIYLQYNDSI